MASSTTSGLDKQTQPVLSCPSPVTPIPTCPDVCAKFITTTPDGRTQSILTCYNVVLTKTPQSTFTQCRKTHPHRQKSRYMVAFSLALAHNMHISMSRSSYVIPDIVVSSLHCKIYASAFIHHSSQCSHSIQSSDKRRGHTHFVPGTAPHFALSPHTANSNESGPFHKWGDY